MHYVKKSATLGALLLVLCACGQRGPLYSPEEAPTKTEPAQSPSQNQSNLQVRGAY